MKYISKIRKTILGSMSFLAFTAGSCSCSVGGPAGQYKPNEIPSSYNRNFDTETNEYSNLDNNLELTYSIKNFTVKASDLVLNAPNGIPSDPQIGEHNNSLVIHVALRDNPIVNFNFVVDGLLLKDSASGFNESNAKQLIKDFFHSCAYGVSMSNFRLIFVAPSEGDTITSYTTIGAHGVVITWPFNSILNKVPANWDLNISNWTSNYLLSTWNHEYAHFEYYNNTWTMNKGAWYSNNNYSLWRQTQLDNLIYFYTEMGDEKTAERLMAASLGGIDKRESGLLCGPTQAIRVCNSTSLFPSDLESYRNSSQIYSYLQDQNYEWSWTEFDAREITQLSYLVKNPADSWKNPNSISGYLDDYFSRRAYTQENAYGSNQNNTWSDDNWRKALTEEQYWYGDVFGLGHYNEGYENINKIFPVTHSQFLYNINPVNSTNSKKENKYYERFGFGWYSSQNQNSYPATMTMTKGTQTITLTKHIFQVHYLVKQTQNSNLVTPYNQNKYLVYYMDDNAQPTVIDTGVNQSWLLSSNLPNSELAQKLGIVNRDGKTYIETI